MKNRIVAGITLLSFFAASGLPALALGPVAGNVEAASGQVLVRAGQQWESLQGQDIPVGTTVRTGADGEAIVRVGSSRLRVAANSEFRVVSVNDQQAEVALSRGRVLGRVGDRLVVTTDRSTTSASRGEFVLETTSEGSTLRVLSGDANLIAGDGEQVTFGALSAVASPDGNSLSSVGSLGQVSAVGDVAMLGEWQSKGKGQRIRNTDETVGGEGDASPDQDVPPPRRPDPPVVNDTPPPVTPPTTPPTPPTTPPTNPTPPVASGGGFGAGWIIGGLALIGGIVALTVDSDDDNDNVFVPGNPGVPSPALP